MKKGIAIFILFLLIFSNLKPIAHALNTTQVKSRFALFCMVSKDGDNKTSCPHESCPIMDSNSKAKEKSCDTKIGCETTHHQEASPSFVNGNEVYIPNVCSIEDYEQSLFFNFQPLAFSLRHLALSIDKPPQNIA
ncbi:MAG: hypothetical protein HZB79_04720 [Deltaproteobacteria bacterium]|nr:hypothetical protein [Deltaproteobacteria bacterium]